MNKFMRTLPAVVAVLAVSIGAETISAGAADDAAAILEKSGIQGGLIVHVGCGDGTLTAALRQGDRYIVHGLDRSAQNVDAARRHVQAQGLQGKISTSWSWTTPRTLPT